MFTVSECHTHSFSLLPPPPSPPPPPPPCFDFISRKTVYDENSSWRMICGLRAVCVFRPVSLTEHFCPPLGGLRAHCLLVYCLQARPDIFKVLYPLPQTYLHKYCSGQVGVLTLPARTHCWLFQTNNCMETIRDNLISQYFIAEKTGTLTLNWQEAIILNLLSTPRQKTVCYFMLLIHH